MKMPWLCFICGSEHHDCGHREGALIEWRRDQIAAALDKNDRKPQNSHNGRFGRRRLADLLGVSYSGAGRLLAARRKEQCPG